MYIPKYQHLERISLQRRCAFDGCAPRALYNRTPIRTAAPETRERPREASCACTASLRAPAPERHGRTWEASRARAAFLRVPVSVLRILAVGSQIGPFRVTLTFFRLEVPNL